MAHYVPIPKDLNDIKEKFIMGFTKRQVICFGIGLVLGAPVYFLTRASIGMSGAIFAMGAVAAPAILCGIYGNQHRKYCSHECYIKDRFKNGGKHGKASKKAEPEAETADE